MQHCIKNNQDSFVEITTWAQEITVSDHSLLLHPQMQRKNTMQRKNPFKYCILDAERTLLWFD